MADQHHIPALEQLGAQAGAWEWLRGWKGVRFDDCGSGCGEEYCASCSFVAMIQRVVEAASQVQREQLEQAQTASKYLESALIEKVAMLDAVHFASIGQDVGDFAESFPIVRAVVDMRLRAEAAEQQLEQAEASHRATAEDAAKRLGDLLSRAEKAEQQLVQVTLERGDYALDAMAAEAELDSIRTVLKELRINANRLCDRNQGGTYEEDCRRSIAHADAVLSRAFQAEQVSHD